MLIVFCFHCLFFQKVSQLHVVNKFLIIDSTSLLVIGLFRYSIHGLVFVGFVFLAVCAFYLASFLYPGNTTKAFSHRQKRVDMV